MSFEPTRFLVPYGGADEFSSEQAPPPPERSPLAGPSKFAASSGALDRAAAPMVAIPGPAAADEYIFDILARYNAVIDARGAPAANSLSGAAGTEPASSAQEILATEGRLENQARLVPFDEINSIATPVAGSAETVVLRFKVPRGYNGLIEAIYNEYTGGGFLEGSGDLIWRIRLNSEAVRNYGNIRTTMGSLVVPRPISGGVFVMSDQLVEYTIEHTAGSGLAPGPGTRILCGLRGLFRPR